LAFSYGFRPNNVVHTMRLDALTVGIETKESELGARCGICRSFFDTLKGMRGSCSSSSIVVADKRIVRLIQENGSTAGVLGGW